jgi:[glutamine synthetase] adenylyltransferase / [glutamine synthetase]-adenylyl-L-tyrosine phosphorylase
VQAARLDEWLWEPLSRCPDPEMALANLARWTGMLTSASATFATLEEDPRLTEDLLRVFSSSQYLSDILIREPTAYTLLLEPDAAWEGEDLPARLAALVAPYRRPESRLEALRRVRRREFFRIGWREICGRASFQAIVTRISDLAAALIDQTLVTVRAPLAESQPELDAQVRFAVIGMGKLGGRELNYSSDVDLLFIYDSPTPADAAHLRYATRLAEALFAALSAATAEGALFRVDMRLRPEGRYGALVRSLASYREYYDRWMETWERQALIKARPVAGDPELGRRFAALAEERAYPTLHATTLFEDVRDVRAAIERRVEARDQTDTNVKEGRGTIREIEFTVQLLQLLFGARRPEVRSGSTLEALARLETAGLLTGEERSRFAGHYVFFRTVEHRLQIMDDLPVRLLPDDPAELRKLALRMGCSPSEADGFRGAYRARADEVQQLSRGILDRLTVDGVAATDPLRLMIMGLSPHLAGGESGDTSEHPNAPLIERLSDHGFRNAAAAVERLRSLATGAPKFSLPVSTTRLFADLAEPLLTTAAAAPDPDGALEAVAVVAERLGAHRTFYQTLRQQPDMLRVLCHIVGFSPVVREQVLRSPELLDVLYDEPFRDMERPAAEMRAEMQARLERAFSPADRLAALRRFQKRELLRIIARDLLLEIDTESTASELSDLADACVAGALPRHLEGVANARRPTPNALPRLRRACPRPSRWSGYALSLGSGPAVCLRLGRAWRAPAVRAARWCAHEGAAGVAAGRPAVRGGPAAPARREVGIRGRPPGCRPPVLPGWPCADLGAPGADEGAADRRRSGGRRPVPGSSGAVRLRAGSHP